MPKALIMGASSDIGIALCRLYLEKGFEVWAHYNEGQKPFFDLLEEHAHITSFQLDMCDMDAVSGFLGENGTAVSDTDVLISAVGLFESVPYDHITTDHLLSSLKANTLSPIMFTQAVTRGMVNRGFGWILYLSSIGVRFRGGSVSYAYALSKHALEFFPSQLKDWAGHNVFINAIRVGVTDTRLHRKDPQKDMKKRVSQIPAGRMASVEEIASSVYDLGSDHNTFTTGQVLTVAGGE